MSSWPESASSRRYALSFAERSFGAALYISIGLSGYGCGDTATVNPMVELANLTVNPGTLRPSFSGANTQYNVDVSDTITSVTITAQPAVAEDTVTINGQATTSSVITLGAAGTTTPVSIVVAESGTNSRTYTVLIVRAGLTGNNSLRNLAVSPGTLAPAFDENTQSYAVDVANDVGNIAVTPTLSDPAATMTVNGQTTTSGQARTLPLNPAGQTTNIPIVVTAQNGSEKTYFLTVSRGVSGNTGLRSLTVSPGTLSPAFSSGTVGYTVNVASSVMSVTVTPTLQETTASVTVNGQAINSGQARTVVLSGADSNTFINIVVTAQNNTQRTYLVNVRRAPASGNDNLSALAVSPGSLTPRFSANRLTYSVEVPEDVTSVTISATKSDSNATMSGAVTAAAGTATGQAPIQLGGPGTRRDVSITVTAPNGGSQTYTVTIERTAQASNNNLSALTVSPGTLTPRFSANRLTYSVEVPEDVASVTLSATKSDPNAVMSGAVTAAAGTATGQATIQLGGPGTSRGASITVTAPNGGSQTYTVTIERVAQASNNNLSALTVSPGSLTPAFSAARTNYTVNVASNVTNVTVTAVLQDANAGMEVNGQGTSSGQAREISLGAEGSSTNISVRVNPPNGNAKTYTVTVNRASSGGNGGGNGNDGGNGDNNGNGNNNGNRNDGNNRGGRDDGDDD